MSRMTRAQLSAVPGPSPACAGCPERFFPLQESERAEQPPTAGERSAVAVCRRCPLMAPCREAVLELPLPYGVAGGLTAAQRRRIRAQRAGRADGQRQARRAPGAVA